jgi:galactonate dehydratase
LKITDISVHLVNAVWRNFIIVKVTSDDGVTGYGEATLADFERTIEAAVYDYRPFLIGKEIDIPEITQFLFRHFYWRGGPMLMSAMSAIEQALWDIIGKSAQKPVYELLGGRASSRVRAYANGFISGSASPADFGDAAARVVKEEGFNAVKFDPFGGAGPRISRDDLKTALARIEAVRNAIGENPDILIEAHGRFDSETAVSIASELKRYSPLWFEEPVPEDDIASMAEVKAKSPVTIATGERIVTKYRFQELLAARAAGIIQPDVCHVGGIREITQIAAMAEVNYVSLAPHNPNGPVATAATLNALITMPNALILEFWLDAQNVRRDLIKEYFDVRDGYVYPSNKPGLGIEVNEPALERYPYKKLHLEYFGNDYKYHGGSLTKN